MYRSIPAPNKLLQKKWEDHDLEMHYRRIACVKSSVNNKKPAKTHLGASKCKKDQIVEDRMLEIERENAVLVERMSSILRSRSSARLLMTTPGRSLNRNLRKRKLEEVAVENLGILSRIQLQKSSYDVKKLEDSHKFHERLLKHVCKYPYALSRSKSSSQGLRSSESQDAKTDSIKAGGSTKPRRLNPLDEEVVYKASKTIMKKEFLVAIIKTARNVKMIVQDTGNQELFSLRLSLKEAAGVLENTQDYKRLANCLTLDNGELVLIEAKAAESGMGDADCAMKQRLESVNEQPVELEGRSSEKVRESTRLISTMMKPEAYVSDVEWVEISPKSSADPIEIQGLISFDSKSSIIQRPEPSKPAEEPEDQNSPHHLMTEKSLKDLPTFLQETKIHQPIPISEEPSLPPEDPSSLPKV